MPGKNTKIHLLVSLLICLAALGILPRASAEPARSTYTVTTTLDSGAGSLRQAILDSNSLAGKDYIYFDIPTSAPGYDPGAGIFQINVSIILPSLDDPNGVEIDGTTQPGYVSGQKPKIIVSGYGLPSPGSIFTISSGSNGNTIRGLALGGVAADILTINGDNNLIEENEIRYSSTGNGITINSSASGNFIYTNHIFGNLLNGVHLISSSGNVLWRNVIGLTPDWMGTSNPNGHSGILCVVCSNNQILENTISGNMNHGIYLSTAGSNQIRGNRVGLSKNGLVDQGNANHGIQLGNNCVGNNIFENWVSGNGKDGIHINDDLTTNNHIELNAVGYAYDGSFIPNGEHGIGIYDGAYGNYVGKFGDTTRGNIVGGNGWSGVVIVNSPTGMNYVYGNHIQYNQWYGVHVDNSPDNVIGFNTIAHNGIHATHAGVRIQGATALGNAITKNSIHANTGLGIELVDGGNAMLVEPLLYSATCSTVTGTTCAGCKVQIYSDRDYEGEIYETEVTADGSGNFTYSDPLVTFRGPNITAIAFSGNNTSPFALPRVGACQHFFLPLIFR